MNQLTFEPQADIYNQYDFNTENIFMNNRLFATFTQQNTLNDLVDNLSKTYDIMYKKMFVLFVKDTNEYIITYNVEDGNINNIPVNTILVHRKKDFNVLYSINALNDLVKKLNGGFMDPNYKIDWSNYKNSILLTQQGQFKQLNTKIYKIINL